MKILLATSNLHKVCEVKSILNIPDLEIITLVDLNDKDEVEENGKSFRENAYIKANYYYQKYHLPTFSDDSGLVVEALNGAPGIYSSRFSGLGTTENNKKLLHLLENVTNRNAHFQCSICYIEDGQPHYFDGFIYGEITTELSGDNGFGYDPLFYIPKYKQTLAQLDSSVKNQISHRYNALIKLLEYLKK